MMMTFIELDEIDLALSGFKLKIINSDTLKYLSALLLHTINRTIEKKKKNIFAYKCAQHLTYIYIKKPIMDKAKKQYYAKNK